MKCTRRRAPSNSLPLMYQHIHDSRDQRAPTDLGTFIEWFSRTKPPFSIDGDSRFSVLDYDTKRALYSNFVSVDIQHEVEQKLLDKCFVEITIPGLVVRMNIYHAGEDVTEISKSISDIGSAACLIYELSKKGIDSSHSVPNTINLNVWRTNAKKCFPPHKTYPITCKHVNSGSTSFYGGKSSYIDIWRKEELLKVAIHEMIHYFQWDFFCDHQHTRLVRDHFVISDATRLTLNETFTEVLATIIYSCVTGDSLEDVKDKLKTQYNYGLNQSSLILTHYDFDSSEQLLRSEGGAKELDLLSDVFSYHVLKSCVLRQYPLFLDTFVSDNMYLNTSRAGINNYQKFLIGCFDETYRQHLNHVLNRNKGRTSGKSLRMTKAI